MTNISINIDEGVLEGIQIILNDKDSPYRNRSHAIEELVKEGLKAKGAL